jgi:hypothetical protein
MGLPNTTHSDSDEGGQAGLRGLIAAMFSIYLVLLPFAHWLAPSGWLPLPNIPLLIAACLCIIGGVGRFRLAWRDLIVLGLVAIAVLSTLLNGGTLTAKSVNHMAALMFVSLLNYFVGGRILFSVLRSSWKTPLLVGFLFACALCVFEFVLVNFFDTPLPGYRPTVVEYDSTFLLGVRPRSTFAESGHFAFYLACIAPLLVAAYRTEKDAIAVKLVFVAVTLCSILLFSTSLFLVLALWGLIAFVLKGVYLKPLGFIVMCGAIVLFMIFSVELLRIADVLVLHKFRLFSFDDRQEKFVAVLELMRDSDVPHVLFGYGMGSFLGLGMEDSISSYANFLRDTGLVGFALFLSMLLPIESLDPRLSPVWQSAFLYLGVGMLLYFSAVPNYYFPHLAFALGALSSANEGPGLSKCLGATSAQSKSA